MKPYKFFIYWILTVLLGSFSLGLIDFFFYQKRIVYSEFFSHAFELMLTASIFSFLFSIPSMIILFIINYLYCEKEGFGARKVLIGKLIVIIITFGVILLSNYSENINWIFIIAFSYGTIGYLFWWIEFKRIKSKPS